MAWAYLKAALHCDIAQPQRLALIACAYRCDDDGNVVDETHITAQIAGMSTRRFRDNVRRLEDVEGVAKVRGGRGRGVSVWLDLEAIQGRGVPEIETAVKGRRAGSAAPKQVDEGQEERTDRPNQNGRSVLSERTICPNQNGRSVLTRTDDLSFQNGRSVLTRTDDLSVPPIYKRGERERGHAHPRAPAHEGPPSHAQILDIAERYVTHAGDARNFPDSIADAYDPEFTRFVMGLQDFKAEFDRLLANVEAELAKADNAIPAAHRFRQGRPEGQVSNLDRVRLFVEARCPGMAWSPLQLREFQTAADTPRPIIEAILKAWKDREAKAGHQMVFRAKFLIEDRPKYHDDGSLKAAYRKNKPRRDDGVRIVNVRGPDPKDLRPERVLTPEEIEEGSRIIDQMMADCGND